MKKSVFLLICFVLPIFNQGCSSSETSIKSRKEDSKRNSFSHTVFFDKYELSLSNPVSPSGLYKLLHVYDDMRVKLMFSEHPEQARIVVAQREGKADDDVLGMSQYIVVLSADPIKQTAILGEWRGK